MVILVDSLIALAVFLTALLVSLAIIPDLMQRAIRWGLVDRPDKKRKLHSTAIPLIGGIAIFVTVVTTLALYFILFRRELALLRPDIIRLIGLLIACSFILFIGFLDDRFEIRGRQKLLGQIIAATILIACGFRFEQISVMGQTFDLGVFSVIAVYLWLLVGINSVNLLDGADGFAATIGLMMSLALCAISISLGNWVNALITAAAAGALVGFLRFNFPPASAYLGDAGSMLIGLFVSAMAVHCVSKQTAFYAFFAPIALLAIPMFDTVAAIVRRHLTGRSIYTVDRGHLHHALLRKGFGPRKALLLFFAMCLMTAIGGTLAVLEKEAIYAIASISAVIIFLIVGRVFGFAEFRLVANRTKTLIRSFLLLPKHRNSHQVSVRLQGERDWDLCWQVLREFAEKSNLVQLTMDLNLPWIHESFHAKFHQPDNEVGPDEQWTAELPLLVADRTIGRIDLIGSVGQTSFYDTIGELADVLHSLQPYFIQTMKSLDETEAAPQSFLETEASQFHAATAEPGKSHALDVG